MKTNQNIMKTYFVALLLISQGFVALSQDNKTPYQTKALSGSIKNVFAKTSGGSISVSGAAGQTPRVEIFVTGNNGRDIPKDEIAKRLEDDYNLSVTTSGDEVHISAKSKHDGGFNWNWKKQLNISFKIYVPKQANTNLSTSGGSIHLDNLSGEENFSTSGGSLHVDQLTGNIKGETSGGSIQVSNSRDNIDLQTSGGSINAANCQGKIKLETSGGSLSLNNLKGSIRANTSGGSINGDNIEGELNTGTSGGSVNLRRMACSLEASTSGGSMHVELLKVGKYVKLEASGGHVDLQLPMKTGMDLNLSASRINKPSAISSFSGRWEKDNVKGSVNGGGVPVNVDASNNLNISFN